MSKGIRYDGLLVHHLAAELRARFAGAALRRLGLDPARRSATLETDRGTLVWELHPERGWVWSGGIAAADATIEFRRGTTLGQIEAPSDERVIRVALLDRRSPCGTVVFELMTNQWNALALDDSGRIGTVLWRRDSGRRTLRPGAVYELPRARPREGVATPVTHARWLELLGGVQPRERAGALVAGVAFTSPLNAAWILGAAAREDGAEALASAHGRYRSIVPPAAPRPVLLSGEPRQPYSFPLGRGAEPCRSLLDAMMRAAAAAAEGWPGGAGPSPVVDRAAAQRLRKRVGRAGRRVARLEEELAGAAPEAARLRASADLLLAQAHAVPKGRSRATLSDFAGGEVEVELDPSLSAVENAQRMYADAKRRERAAARIPELLSRARIERDRLQSILERAERGELPATELREVDEGSGPRPPAADREPRLPYRRYRTSGGLEVRVGRNRAANDELTFHHSSPEDIWLHARDVGGSHVVLRWGRRGENPPARDLAEAAVLAALRSRARSSATVAVDWTRRKYVRKPRKAPPGLVVIERAATLFVEPDPALERRLRNEGGAVA